MSSSVHSNEKACTRRVWTKTKRNVCCQWHILSHSFAFHSPKSFEAKLLTLAFAHTLSHTRYMLMCRPAVKCVGGTEWRHIPENTPQVSLVSCTKRRCKRSKLNAVTSIERRITCSNWEALIWVSGSRWIVTGQELWMTMTWKASCVYVCLWELSMRIHA